jgi:hypothetical protein
MGACERWVKEMGPQMRRLALVNANLGEKGVHLLATYLREN